LSFIYLSLNPKNLRIAADSCHVSQFVPTWHLLNGKVDLEQFPIVQEKSEVFPRFLNFRYSNVSIFPNKMVIDGFSSVNEDTLTGAKSIDHG